MTNNSPRREFLEALAAGAALTVLPRPAWTDTTPSRSTGEPRPNILLALADDWNWPHSATTDVKVVRTPVYDRVCREGVRFTNAFVTAPSCTPSASQSTLPGTPFAPRPEAEPCQTNTAPSIS